MIDNRFSVIRIIRIVEEKKKMNQDKLIKRKENKYTQGDREKISNIRFNIDRYLIIFH